ncbi:metal-dependent hydrolase [Breoghania sp.]|uniref:metal-dependent hydrolase n=1 Tax=Breoghania sp. TaxID=2065378 RepID=UPI002AA8976F|nr:metal-dependent hydrolase [Breoghania sp.]
MLTAHLPAGYCLSRLAGKPHLASPGLLATVLICSVLPDFDLIWFQFVDNGSLHHHRYWVHVPFFWGVVGMLVIPLVWRTRFRSVAILGLAAIFLHLVLDTIAGGIMWLAPLDTTLYRLVEIPPTYSHAMISFLLHWTFLLEIAVWFCAIALFVTARQRQDEVVLTGIGEPES